MIYAIKAVSTEFVKIGVSNGLGRIASLQVGCPFELVLIAQADWPKIEERRIHGFLKRHGLHVRGEWFKREGETERVINLLRDGHVGLAEWHKLLTPTYNRRLAKILALK